MRYLFSIIFIITICINSCQTEESLNGNGDMGYLRIEASSVTSTETKSTVPENYNPQQLYVEIRNEAGTVVTSTDDYDTHWKGTKITLKAGTYTITASSNGFDGQASGFDIPYYQGSKQISVIAGKEVSAEVVCTLANVKVSVSFSDKFKQAFTSAKVKIVSTITGIASQEVTMGSAQSTSSIYLPVGNFKAELEVKNTQNTTHTLTKELTEVKARDHYLLNYKLADQGNASIKIEADSKEQEYNFTFNVSKEVATSLGVKKPNAWSTFALLEGEVISSTGVLDPACMKFEYKKNSDTEWTSIVASANNSIYTAKLTGLTPSTNYSYRMCYQKEPDLYTSEAISFSTEEQPKLENLNFDNWVKSGKNYYANSSMDIHTWDSGNEGANMVKEINPTQPEETDVIRGKAARLGSTTTAGQFVAGSLFTGDFGKASISPLGATLDFGVPFNGRPTKLTGYYKYNPGTINMINTDRVTTVKEGERDICSIYIALLDWSAPFAVNTGEDKFFTPDSEGIIAYGELDAEKCSPSTNMNSYEQFTIDLKYRNLTKKPTYILIVCSSSKYGDYFTGSTSSVLLLDEFDFVYGEPTIDPQYITVK